MLADALPEPLAELPTAMAMVEVGPPLFCRESRERLPTMLFKLIPETPPIKSPEMLLAIMLLEILVTPPQKPPPPPPREAELPEMVQFLTVREPWLYEPAPFKPELLVIVELEIVKVPWLAIAPPYGPKLPENVELETEAIPWLKIPPPK